ncbi:MAG: Gfo/Idh/MocA family oxidoreductase [Planctomycetes bacterium]|nr:Gfo/Idh/MocA family oxidoreductase [Planctomycetota bacterium]
METGKKQVTRRDFLKGATAAAATAAMAGAATHYVYAAGSDVIKVGLVGCGGRGKGALGDCLKAAEQSSAAIQVVAFGDLWPERAKSALAQFKGDKTHGSKVAATDAACFGGFDNCDKVCASGIDLLVTAAPPGFRPLHFAAAIRAGKNVFMEKPVCVDPWGYRVICAAAEEAQQKKLTVVAGTQRRHSKRYQATIEQIHKGALGKLTGGQFYWMGGPVTHNRPRGAAMSDIEWQCSNWYAWSWTCGDHIVEQHVHNLDIMLWAMGSPPESAVGVGGRQVRPETGNIFDHFAIEYQFPGGVRCASYCSHWPKGAGRVNERVVGEKGSSNCNGDITGVNGENLWKYAGEDPHHGVQEHIDLLNSIRGKGKHWNEAKQVADSSMTAVLGRMCAYTGREIKWDWATRTSKLKLGPDKLAFGPYTPDPVAKPGETELI